jgi:hypothetical protein
VHAEPGLARVDWQVHVLGQLDRKVVDRADRLERRGSAAGAGVEDVARCLLEDALVGPLRVLAGTCTLVTSCRLAGGVYVG